MEVYKLLGQEKAAAGYTHRVRLTHADLSQATANTVQTIQMITVREGDVVQAAAYRLVDEFEDASDNAFNVTTITVGDGGDVDRFIVSKEINVNGTEVDNWATAQVTDTLPYAYGSADTIDIVFTSMAAKALVDIDVGNLDVFLKVGRTY